MERRKFLAAGVALGMSPVFNSYRDVTAEKLGCPDRDYWVKVAKRIAQPVLDAVCNGRLKQDMPVEATGNRSERRKYAHLEAFGRTLVGIAPWLEQKPLSASEDAIRTQFAQQARAGIHAATDPASPDFMNFSEGDQPLVDTAFLALAIVRAPRELAERLEPRVLNHLVSAFMASRKIVPYYSNWVLFPAMIETALARLGAKWDPVRIDYAIRSVNSWYKGDGHYGDGPEFHFDFYNSYVIHPMLLGILEGVEGISHQWDSFRPEIQRRARRYAAVQERMIEPDGAFPPIGRSLCYRFGAFHLLADMALRRDLPEGIHPAQVRCALTAVMRKMIEAPGTFDSRGWLRIGFCGSQPGLAESYISTGSSYLCSAALLPLGLPDSDPFWTGAFMPWTAKKAWEGEMVAADHALPDVSS